MSSRLHGYGTDWLDLWIAPGTSAAVNAAATAAELSAKHQIQSAAQVIADRALEEGRAMEARAEEKATAGAMTGAGNVIVGAAVAAVALWLIFGR